VSPPSATDAGPPAGPLSPEFALALACCRWPPSPGRDALVRAAAAGVDWSRFEAVVRRHRIAGLAWDALTRAGADPNARAARAIAAAATASSRENLVNLGESLRLQSLLRARGVEPLFLKGLALAELAYGTIALKSGWDIDILVPPDALAASVELLEEEGYELLVPLPPRGRERLVWWHGRWKESVWGHRSRGTHVELHLRLVDNQRLLTGIPLPPPSQQVEVAPGRFLPTLADEPLFAYLCVHGASSAWFRLKWIADLAALLTGRGPEEIERLYRRSQELGAGRAAAQALLLCAALFDAPLGEKLRAELAGGRANRWLVRTALAMMSGRFEVREPAAARFGTAALHLSQFALLPGFRFKLAEAWRQASNPRHRVNLRLPGLRAASSGPQR
jgi:hypothetical protein